MGVETGVKSEYMKRYSVPTTSLITGMNEQGQAIGYRTGRNFHIVTLLPDKIYTGEVICASIRALQLQRLMRLSGTSHRTTLECMACCVRYGNYKLQLLPGGGSQHDDVAMCAVCGGRSCTKHEVMAVNRNHGHSPPLFDPFPRNSSRCGTLRKGRDSRNRRVGARRCTCGRCGSFGPLGDIAQRQYVGENDAFVYRNEGPWAGSKGSVLQRRDTPKVQYHFSV
jgi:hypothetical protein